MQGMLVLAVTPLIAYALPLENLERAVGLYGTPAGLVLAMASVQIPLALWLLRGYLERIHARWTKPLHWTEPPG